MSKETSSTIGEQRRFNYALQPMSKDKFVAMMTAELPDAPAYFPTDVEINRTGARALTEVAKPAPLTPDAVKKLVSEGHVILDVRTAAEFGAGHVPAAINVGLGGQFAIWSGILIAIGTPIILVAESEAKVEEAVMRLARVGIESAKGYLAGGMEAWHAAGFETETVPQLTVDKLNSLIESQPQLQVIDVRQPSEYESGHVPRAFHAPLAKLEQAASGLPVDPSKPTAVICAGGYRSSAATSILQQRGFKHLMNVSGGTGAWIKAGYPVETPD